MSALATALVDSGLAAVETLGVHYVAITGRCVPWNEPQNVGGYIEEWKRGAFTRSLTRQNRLPLLPFHDNKSVPIGTSVAWSDERDGLYGTFEVHMTGAAQLAGDYAAKGIISGLSIGFIGEEAQWRYAATYAPDLGVDYMDSVTRTRARLIEVSLVSTPAYIGAVVTHVQSEAV